MSPAKHAWARLPRRGSATLALPVRQTLALVTLAMGLCATLAVAGIVGEDLRSRLERQAALALTRHAALVAATLDRAFYDRWRDLQVASIVEAEKLRAGSDTERRQVIDRIRAGHPDFSWVGYASRDGIVRAANDGLLIGRNVGDRPWFAGGLKGMFVGDLHDARLLADVPGFGQGERSRLLDLAAPVMDASGETVGVLGAHFPPTWASRVEESLRQSLQAEMPGAQVQVLTRDGLVLLGLPFPSADGRMDGMPAKDHDVWHMVGPDGRIVLAASLPTRGYRDYPGLGWSVVVSQDEEATLAPAHTLRRDVLTRGIPLSLLAALLAFLLADALRRPLNELRSAASTLGVGEAVGRRYGPFRELRQIGEALDAASASLREREARFEAERKRLSFALEGANDGIWDWDIASGEVWYSPRWLDMLGYRQGELKEHFSSWERIVHPEDKDAVLAALDGHRGGGCAFYEAEHRLWHKEQRWVWVLTRGKIVERDAEGRPLRAVGTHTDITARKGVEEALAASEARFRTLFERAPIGIADVTPGCRFSAVNDQFCRIVGYGREELIGRTFQEITHPDDVAADARQVRDLLAGRIPHYDMEKRYVRKDGGVIWAHLAVGLVRDERGRPSYFLSSIKDVTARKEAERALNASETFTRSVVESSTDCIKVLDLDGRVQFMNGLGLCAMEVDDFDLVRDGIWSGFWPEGMRAEIERAVAAARGGSRERLVAFCPTMKGTPKWWDVCVTPVRGPDGRPERLLAVSREITGLKQAEERLHLMMGELNHRVKNLFATVQAVMRLSVRPGDDVDAYKARILARLSTLARTNEILFRASWSGASLRELICSELDPYDFGERLGLDGPLVTLQAGQAVPVAMIVHELTTNAAKHGSLSTPDGTLSVAWEIEAAGLGRHLRLTWIERRGPPVAPPTRKGFGSRLITDGLARELRAEVSLAFHAEGLEATLAMPLD